MFNYFAAGLPVLASGHAGLDPVSEFSAGIQVASCDPDTLVAAGQAVLAAYAEHSKGAHAAALANDFDVGCSEYIGYLQGWSAT
jgi:hypothetical protein